MTSHCEHVAGCRRASLLSHARLHESKASESASPMKEYPMTRIRRLAAPAICFASLGVLSFSSSALAAYSSEFGSYTQSNINYVDSTHQQYGEWSESATYSH